MNRSARPSEPSESLQPGVEGWVHSGYLAVETTDPSESSVLDPSSSSSFTAKLKEKEEKEEREQESEEEIQNDKSNLQSIQRQEEEDRKLALALAVNSDPSRRTTRSGGSRPSRVTHASKKSTTPKKSSRSNPFNAPCILSPALATLLSCSTEEGISRPQTIKRIWEVIRANGWQDPKDKRFILCSSSPNMLAVFGKPRISMFGMNKILSKHIKLSSEIVGGKDIEDSSSEGEDDYNDDGSGDEMKHSKRTEHKTKVKASTSSGKSSILSQEYIDDSDDEE